MTRRNDLGLVGFARAAFGVALGATLFAACGKTTGDVGGSGETHFLATCDGDADCGADLSCLCGVCTAPCAEDGACDAWGATCSGTCGGGQAVCDQGCTGDADCSGLGEYYECNGGQCRFDPPPVVPDAGGRDCPSGCEPLVGAPVDETRGCVDLDRSAAVACVCGNNLNGFNLCKQRLEDGTAWTLPDGELDDPSAWRDCTDAQQEASLTACDFAECARRPISTCSADDFCQSGACGGLEYDESGCRRADCAADADCPQTERCTAIECADVSSCSYTLDGTCQCGGPAICAYGNACAPVDIAGPRGDWQSFTVDVGSGPCPPGPTCTTQWTFTPDGQVVFSKQGTPGSATMESFDLDDLRRVLDGAPARLAFRDGIPCDGPPTDIGVSMTLTLSTGALSRDVTGCALTGPEGNVFERLYQTANRY